MRSAPLHFICFLRLVVLDDVFLLIIFVIIAEVVVIQIIGALGIPGVEVMRTKLKKYDKTYKELTAENAELEKKLSSASKESVRKKLEISQKLNELDELRRTVDAIPDEVIRAYTAQKYVHHGRMNQEI